MTRIDVGHVGKPVFDVLEDIVWVVLFLGGDNLGNSQPNFLIALISHIPKGIFLDHGLCLVVPVSHGTGTVPADGKGSQVVVQLIDPDIDLVMAALFPSPYRIDTNDGYPKLGSPVGVGGILRTVIWVVDFSTKPFDLK